MMTPSHATPVLRAVRLNRTFNDGVRVRHALREVSVNLYPGQLALLMGPSGSGKSTLLAVLSGLLKPDSGQIFAQDQGNTVDLWSLKDAEREQFRAQRIVEIVGVIGNVVGNRRRLCLKAGMDGNEWKKGKLEVYTYQVQAFEEEH